MAPNTRLGLRHGAPIEPPIGFDRQEEDRIRLEQEIGGLSLDLEHSGSTSLSLEYGRNGVPSPRFEGVASFARYDSDLEKSRDASARRSTRYQSFRTVDDSYDGGQTQSTAAHHASRVTIGAGLGYGAGARPASRAGSGAEYDPDRELSSMLKRRGRISLLDDTNTTVRDPSATKKSPVQHISSDPLIVDDTAELDHLLEAGHIPEHSLRAQPRIPRAQPAEDESRRSDLEYSFHRSEADDSFSRRKPRLTDALGGTFSPKRPRTLATNTSLSPNGMQHKPLPSITSASDASVRPSASLLASRPSNIPAGGTTRTDSSLSSSSATQRARLEANTAANARRAAYDSAPAPAPTRRVGRQNSNEKRQDVAPAQTSAFPRASATEAKNRNVFRPGLSIHLPDITGLTVAVASPVKAKIQYKDAQVGSPKHGLDADRSAADAQLEQLSNLLRELERENGTARRRVRELEIELDYCKAEVERERTRVSFQETERARANERQAASEREERERRIRETEESAKSWESRYHEVVEEKKALEALVTTLRSHLARMTSEVEEHQRTIDELRSMHERDVADLEAKTAEVAAITAEVERLADECDRLRGVVEEGLRERRQVRESGSLQASGSQKDFEGAGSVIIGRELSAVEEEEEQTEDEMNASELEGQRSVLSVTELAGDDRSGRARTDRATLGSVSRTLRFMDPPPPMTSQSDITPELEPSRSMGSSRSIASPPEAQPASSRSSTPILGRPRSAAEATAGTSSPVRRGSPLVRRASEDEGARPSRPSSRLPLPPRSGSPTPPQRSPARDPESQPLRASQRRSPPPASPPFPRIRGAQLERLFFSAPEHDERTCTTCCRRRNIRTVRDDRHEPERVRQRERAGWRLGGRVGAREDEDEGYAHSEGEDDLPVEIDPARPPPQTVLVKVMRELEDDFAHYKAIYVELADQYRIIGPASNVAKRNVLAEHLKEVIDTLEKRGDQIASLYDLISANDKPVSKQS
ncbi:hypothetical protein OPQ81_011658 [Rhizoctonia solani]|nr:hypothetical protein OPQ81_011658 [Rhizoctonia solani]